MKTVAAVVGWIWCERCAQGLVSASCSGRKAWVVEGGEADDVPGNQLSATANSERSGHLAKDREIVLYFTFVMVDRF